MFCGRACAHPTRRTAQACAPPPQPRPAAATRMGRGESHLGDDLVLVGLLAVLGVDLPSAPPPGSSQGRGGHRIPPPPPRPPLSLSAGVCPRDPRLRPPRVPSGEGRADTARQGPRVKPRPLMRMDSEEFFSAPRSFGCFVCGIRQKPTPSRGHAGGGARLPPCSGFEKASRGEGLAGRGTLFSKRRMSSSLASSPNGVKPCAQKRGRDGQLGASNK